MKKKAQILIINEHLDARARLREALKSAVFDSVIDQAKTPAEGLQKYESGTAYDVIFLESFRETSKIHEFVRKLDGFRKGRNSIVIVTIKSQHLDSAYIASLFLEGVEGFICEPYSSSELQEIFQTTRDTATKGLGDASKRRRLLEFLLVNAQQFIDKIAQDRAAGEEQGGYALKELRAVSKNLRELYEKDPAQYGEVIAERFSNVPPPKASASAGPKKPKKLVRHPGFLIREALAARRLSFERITTLLKVDPKEFEEMLNEQRNLDEAMARDISRILGETQAHWMRLQREYDAVAAKRKELEKKRSGSEPSAT